MSRQPPSRNRGAALVTALLLVLAVLMLAVSAARIALNAAAAARIERERHIALQAAEAALADAERDIAGAAGPASARAFAFAAAAAFAEGCGRAGDGLGLCGARPAPAAPIWQAIDLAGDAAVPYGRFTGAVIPVGHGLLPARAPRYIIERLAPPPGAAAAVLYRITAIGFGSRATMRVVLQSVYRSAAGGAAPAVPAKQRVSWREIANWPELHAAANE